MAVEGIGDLGWGERAAGSQQEGVAGDGVRQSSADLLGARVGLWGAGGGDDGEGHREAVERELRAAPAGEAVEQAADLARGLAAETEQDHEGALARVEALAEHVGAGELEGDLVEVRDQRGVAGGGQLARLGPDERTELGTAGGRARHGLSWSHEGRGIRA